MASERERTLTHRRAVDAAGPRTVTACLLWEGERGRVSVPARALDHRPLQIGRGVSTAGLLLDDPHASRHHATLRARLDGVLLEDHSSNGTFVNGRRVSGSAMLHDGDVVRAGDSFLLVRMRIAGLPTDDVPVDGLDGDSPGMQALRRGIAAVAPTSARVLVLGETGTGKEATARAIHARSGRKGACVAVNCAAIPEALAESQLFGHVRGAFTDALRDHPGFFRSAEGGTLFLDEIGELSQALQAKLLRALEQRIVVPVGGTKEIRVDVRIVAATHRDLAKDVDAGRFRADLYARIAEYTLRTSPLRARREDVLPILENALGKGAPPLSPDLVGALLVHPYRFNVRELLAIARQLLVDGASASQLTIAHAGGRLDVEPVPETRPEPPPGPTSTETRAREPAPSKEIVEALLTEMSGNVSEVARALGRSRRQVHRYMEMYGLDPERFRG